MTTILRRFLCGLFGHLWHGGLTYIGESDGVHCFHERCTACDATRTLCGSRYGRYDQLRVKP